MIRFRVCLLSIAVPCVLVTSALAADRQSTLSGGTPYPLRNVLAADGLPLEGLPVSPDLPIASYQTAKSAGEVVVAYRDMAGKSLGDKIGILIFDRKSGRWSAMAVPEHDERDEADIGGGDIGAVQVTPSFIYVDTHVNPSAGLLVVVSRDGKIRKGLWGWLVALLPDGRVIYQASQVHFAPLHSMELRMYDPGQKASVGLYPEKPWLPVRRAFIEQVASRLESLQKTGAAAADELTDNPESFDSSLVGRVVFDSIGRYVAFLVEFGDPSKPTSPRPERVVVRCDTKPGDGRPGACTEVRLADVIRGDPSLARLSADALLHRVVQGAVRDAGR